MMSDKLDGLLAARVHELEQSPSDAADTPHAERVKVLVHVVGDLAEVERAGLWTETRIGSIAIGTVAVGDLNDVAELDAVSSVESDHETFPHLHTSNAEVRATQARALPPGFSGRGVIVGVIDSGIDIFHHAFRKPDGTTRITSLLDLTLRQTIATTGSPTGGSISLGWQPPQPPAPAGGGTAPPRPAFQTTPSLTFPVTAAQVQSALGAFTGVNAGDIVATGGPLPGTPIAVDFAGRWDSRTFDSSRIDAITFTATLTGGATPRATITRGREFSESDINTALQTPAQPFASRDTNGHGTHVAGTAAGDGSQSGNCHPSDYYIGMAPEAELVIVKTTFDDSANLRGVQHVFTKAGTTKSAVANLSLGGQAGPHDGTDNSEIGLDNLLTGSTKRMIVVAAGNDGELYDHAHPELHPAPNGGLHAFKHIPANGTVMLRVVIRPGDRVADWFHIWYAGAGRLSFNLTTPGAPTGTSLPSAIAAGAGSSGPTLAAHPLFVQSTLNNGTSSRHNIELNIGLPPAGQITPGTWTITLTETAGTDVDVDCWIGLDKSDPHPRFVNLDQDRTRTVTTPGTATLPITIGAYNASDSTLAEFSGRGPTTDNRRKPEICAPGVGVFAALSGSRNTGACCDCCTDFYVDMDGTSMAAPHVAGIVALMFQADPTLDHTAIKTKLLASWRPPDPITGPTLPNNDWGAGKVNAEASVVAAVPTSDTTWGPADDPVVLPLSAYPAVHLAPRRRVHEIERRTAGSPAGELLAALVSEHLDEVQRLIAGTRRVAVAWHRLHGPELTRWLLGESRGDLLLPRTIGAVNVAGGLARLLDELHRAGSPALRRDVVRHRALVLALPGARLGDLDHREAAG